MKYSTILGLTAAATLAAASPMKRQASFAKTDGLKFNIDGVTKYYAGTNAYWLGFVTNDADIDTALDRLQESGLKLLRIWGFNDVNTVPTDGTVWYQSFVAGQDPVINTGADGLQRLDYVVKSAESRGIKLIINFVNNWTDYGGMAAYMKRFGGSANPDWYANADIQAQYKKYIQAVVSRYTDSPAVFAWELANEPRCNGCDTSVIYNWASEISAYIKSLDSNHLVTLGDEGFGVAGGDGSYPYQKGEGVDFSKNLEIETLDYGTFHLYPTSWSQPNEPFGSEWIAAHGAACAAAGKPCVFEEYGVQSDKCNIEGTWQKKALNTTGIAADQFWDFGTTLSWGQTNNDGNTIFTNTSDWECLVTNHVAQIG